MMKDREQDKEYLKEHGEKKGNVLEYKTLHAYAYQNKDEKDEAKQIVNVKLDTQVNFHLQTGWELYGDPVYNSESDTVVQAVVKTRVQKKRFYSVVLESGKEFRAEVNRLLDAGWELNGFVIIVEYDGKPHYHQSFTTTSHLLRNPEPK